MSQPELMIYRDAEELAAAAAERIRRAAAESVAARGRFTLCLTGGSTPRRTYELLARQYGTAGIRQALRRHESARRTRSPIFGREPSSSSATSVSCRRTTIAATTKWSASRSCKMPRSPPIMFLPFPRTWPPRSKRPKQYARTLKTFFGAGVAWPEFDLVLLGLGEDGHTASLFPGAAALQVTDRWATSSPPGVLPPPVDRVTLTFPVFNAARQVMFLVSGANKAEALADVYQGRASVEQRPAAGIRPANGHAVWLVDRAAAGHWKDKPTRNHEN